MSDSHSDRKPDRVLPRGGRGDGPRAHRDPEADLIPSPRRQPGRRGDDTRWSAINADQATARFTSVRRRSALTAFHLRGANDVGHIDLSSMEAVSLKPIVL